MDVTKAAGYAAGLRELADWIDANAERLGESDIGEARLLMCRIDKDEFLEAAQLLGNYEVDDSGPYFTLVRSFGPITVRLFIEKAKIATSTTKLRPTTEWELDPEVQALVSQAVA